LVPSEDGMTRDPEHVVAQPVIVPAVPLSV
jgi:hypothetical protein